MHLGARAVRPTGEGAVIRRDGGCETCAPPCQSGQTGQSWPVRRWTAACARPRRGDVAAEAFCCTARQGRAGLNRTGAG
nr:hypothetical protein RVX_2814 [Nitratidesulfovibrio sp. HK-II]